MTDDQLEEFKKGGRVKGKKRCPKGSRRSKSGRCIRQRSRLPTISERRPSGSTGTLTADKALQFGSGKMAMEARIARLQNLVDTQSSNLNHSALQKHLVALGYKAVPEIQRDQRYLGNVLDSTGARFAGSIGGDEPNFVNGDPYSADRNRLRIQRRWEMGQNITRGEIRQALHDDAWEGENIPYAPRDDDNTYADEAFLGSYGAGQALYDDLGSVADIEFNRRGAGRRAPTGGGGVSFAQERQRARQQRQHRQQPRYGGGARTTRQYRDYGEEETEPSSSGYSSSSGGSSGGGSEFSYQSHPAVYRRPPFGQPTYQYGRGRIDEPQQNPTPIGPWLGTPERQPEILGEYGVEPERSEEEEEESEGETEGEEEFSDIGTSVSGREPERFGERAGQVAGQVAGAVGQGALNLAQVGGRMGLDLGAGAGQAIYDRLPSARDVGEVVIGGGIDLASGAGRAMYNRLPEGPDMGRFLNDASGLVSDWGDTIRGGMRQVPGREILGGLLDRPFDEASVEGRPQSEGAITEDLPLPRGREAQEDEGEYESQRSLHLVGDESPEPSLLAGAEAERRTFVGRQTPSRRSSISSFSDLSGEFYPRGRSDEPDAQLQAERRRYLATAEPFADLIPTAGPPSSVSTRTASSLSDASTGLIERVADLKQGNPERDPSELRGLSVRDVRKVEQFWGEGETTPSREISRLRNRQQRAHAERLQGLSEERGRGRSVEVEDVLENGLDVSAEVAGTP